MTKVELSKEWWMKMADREGDHEIGAGLDIVERLNLLSRGDNLDLADIVCADAVAEIRRLRSENASLTKVASQLFRERGDDYVDEPLKDHERSNEP